MTGSRDESPLKMANRSPVNVRSHHFASQWPSTESTALVVLPGSSWSFTGKSKVRFLCSSSHLISGALHSFVCPGDRPPASPGPRFLQTLVATSSIHLRLCALCSWVEKPSRKCASFEGYLQTTSKALIHHRSPTAIQCVRFFCQLSNGVLRDWSQPLIRDSLGSGFPRVTR